MNKVYEGHEFDAVKWRHENQTELLSRLTLLDLRIFSGYIAIQLALGSWIAANSEKIVSAIMRGGLLIIDLSLAIVAVALLYNNLQRRKEVAGTVRNCNEALGYQEKGVYVDNRPLNSETKFRPWVGWYFLGIGVSIFGIFVLILA